MHSHALLKTLHALGIDIWKEGSNLRYRAPKGAMTPGLQAELRESKNELLEALSGQSRTAFPLSVGQQALLFVQQTWIDSAEYNVVLALEIAGALDVDRTQSALREIVRRHPILGARFEQQADEAIQIIDSASTIDIATVDATSLTEGEFYALLQMDSERPFALLSAPSPRATLYRRGEEKTVLTLCVHHILVDGWSMSILLEELLERLAQAPQKPRSLPKPIDHSYVEFVLWQQSFLRSPQGVAAREFWHQQLPGELPLLDLPTDKPRPTIRSTLGGAIPLQIDAQLTADLKALAQAEGTTLNVVLLSAWFILLHRYSGQRDLICGLPFLGRDSARFNRVIGYFVNMLPIRVQIDSEMTVKSLLQQLSATMLQAIDHGNYPFSWLVQELQPRRDLGRTPLYQTQLAFENIPDERLLALALGAAETISYADLQVRAVPIHQQVGQNEIGYMGGEVGGRLIGYVNYSADLFCAETVTRMTHHFERILQEIATAPEQTIREIPLLDEAERHKLLFDWNHVQSRSREAQCVHALFAEQVERKPHAVAVVYEDQQLTYRELDLRANQLANHLHELGVSPDGLVGLFCERSLEMVVGLLGILKAGGAYVPLEPGLPDERLRDMIEDARLSVLLTQEELLNRLPTIAIPKVPLDLESKQNPWLKHSSVAPMVAVTPAHLVYVIYTSGSTGKPKGVAVEHSNLTNYVQDVSRALELPREASYAYISTMGADLGHTMLFPCLLLGGTLHILSKERGMDGKLFADYMAQHQIDCLKIVPTHLQALLPTTGWERAIPRQRMIFGGESLPWSLAQQLARITRVYNHYGPTETTVGVLTCPVPADEQPSGPSVPLGRPLLGAQVYILDNRMELMPIGVPGEIYIGGCGIARGYLEQPTRTAERFVKNPYGSGRLYKTGDVGKLLSDGRIQFLGRNDFQVKLRGFRIELEEIEAQLRAHPDVAECAVLLREDVRGDKQLVGYLVTRSGEVLSVNELRKTLEAKLPGYMVPMKYVHLAALPRNLNGKLERSALPMPKAHDEGDSETEETTRTPVAEILASIWQQLLGVDKILSSSHFFELGGHSLLVMQLLTRVRKLCGVDLPVRFIFESSTFGELVKKVQSLLLQGTSIVPAIAAQAASELTLPSYGQQRLWLLSLLERQSQLYNSVAGWKITGTLDIAALRLSLDQILARHQVLRSQVVLHEGQAWLQLIQGNSWPLELVDLRHRSDRADEALRLFKETAWQPYMLDRELPIRGLLLRLEDDLWWLCLGFHHIVFDGWSRRILSQELGTLYQAALKGEPSSLPPLLATYSDWAQAQRQWLEGGEASRQQAYWQNLLSPLSAPLELPTDHPRPAQRSGAGDQVDFELDMGTVKRLRTLCQQQEVTLFMALLSVYETLLFRYSRQTDFCIGAPIAGRPHQEVEALLGFFVNMLVLRADLEGEPSFLTLLKRVKERALQAYAYADLPFERLVQVLNPPRDTSRTPIFQVLFVLEGMEDAELTLPGLQVEALRLPRMTAKYDLTLTFRETEEGLKGILGYCTDLFKQETAQRMAGHFVQLLQSALVNPQQSCGALGMLDEAERHHLLVKWNETRADFPETLGIHELFEAQVERSPDAVAVVFDDQRLTYRELNARANQLARKLGALGVGPDGIVGLCVDRSLDMVVGLIGIVKAGGAYMPLEPDFPKERLAFMIKDAAPQALLTQRSLLDRLPELTLPCLFFDDQADWPAESGDNLPTFSQPKSLAYALYTSGSTGIPKGVLIEHRALINLLFSMQSAVAVQPTDTLLAITTLAFDISGLELWLPLISGARILLASRQKMKEERTLAELIATHGVTILQATPAHWRSLFDGGFGRHASLRALIGGEAVPAALADMLAENTAMAWNVYGPTETTIWSTMARLRSGQRPVAIGRPIANTEIYILDALLQPVPIGVPGEIHIGGAGLARGYLHREELTAEKFIRHPFSRDPQARLYKTGDLGRYLEDGNIEYIGRMDHQVKLRGFRIELGEIEAVLCAQPGVRDCVTLLREDRPGDKRLVAYLVAVGETRPDEAALRTALKKQLPEYMVPGSYVWLPTFPLTASGKLDRRALPAPGALEHSEKATEPEAGARDSLELLLVSLWEDILGMRPIGVNQNFFDLGGHSLLVVRLLSRLASATGQSLPSAILFQHQTIAELAGYLRKKAPMPRFETVVALHGDGPRSPLFCVHPIGGQVLCYMELVRALGPEQPVYGVQATPLEAASEQAAQTLEEVAAGYVAAIRNVQKQGPYKLLGWSMGGVLAFEMARQLRQAGEEVGLLALIDSFSPTSRRALQPLFDERDVLHSLVQDLVRQQSLDAISVQVPKEVTDLKSALAYLRAQGLLSDDADAAQLEALYTLFRRNWRLMDAYVPQPYGDPVLLICAQDRRAASDVDHGWRQLSRAGLEEIELPGDHYSLLKRPSVLLLAQKLRKYLRS